MISITGSVGLAIAPKHGDDPQTLMKHAGLALHKAKANGKHQMQLFTEALNAPSWTTCRQVLYHESLRYVPTAATHGSTLTPTQRQDMYSKNSSGVLVNGDDIAVISKQVSRRASTAQRDAIADGLLAREAGMTWELGTTSDEKPLAESM